jgi:hypothetical protein
VDHPRTSPGAHAWSVSRTRTVTICTFCSGFNARHVRAAENQIVIDYEVYARRPHDSDLLVPAIETHQARLGRTPRLLAADAAFYSSKNEAAAKAKGVKRVCIPNRSTKSPERKREQVGRGAGGRAGDGEGSIDEGAAQI